MFWTCCCRWKELQEDLKLTELRSRERSSVRLHNSNPPFQRRLTDSRKKQKRLSADTRKEIFNLSFELLVQ